MPAPAPEATLCHLIDRRSWLAAVAAGAVGAAPEGFVHLSTVEQVPTTVARHLAGVPDLLVLRVDASGLAAAGVELRWEESHPGEWFPHAYRSVPVAAVTALAPLPADGSGVVPAILHDEGTGVVVDEHDRGSETAGLRVAYREADMPVASVVVRLGTDGTGRPRPGCALVDDVRTEPSHEGRGLASWLLARTAARLAASGLDEARLWVRVDNHRARRVYERLGWRRTAGLQGLDGDGHRIVEYGRRFGGADDASGA